MPILTAEPDLYPEDLFEQQQLNADLEKRWWVLYCLPRMEKKLTRRLRELDVAHYCPLVPKSNRSPQGRVRISYIPLFSGYAFLFGSDIDRYDAVTTGCVSRCLEVHDGDSLTRDLSQIRWLLESGATLTLESKYVSGAKVRITSGPFSGVEGVIIRRETKTRLFVAVQYLQQGASMLLDDCQVELVS